VAGIGCGRLPLAFFGRPGEVLAGPPLRRRVEEETQRKLASAGKGTRRLLSLSLDFIYTPAVSSCHVIKAFTLFRFRFTLKGMLQDFFLAAVPKARNEVDA
jgi:hypothetical protein